MSLESSMQKKPSSISNDALNQALQKSHLFEGVLPASRDALLAHLGAGVRAHEDGTLLVRLGDTIGRMGIVVEGVVEVGFYDEAGELATVNRLDARRHGCRGHCLRGRAERGASDGCGRLPRAVDGHCQAAFAGSACRRCRCAAGGGQFGAHRIA